MEQKVDAAEAGQGQTVPGVFDRYAHAARTGGMYLES